MAIDFNLSWHNNQLVNPNLVSVQFCVVCYNSNQRGVKLSSLLTYLLNWHETPTISNKQRSPLRNSLQTVAVFILLHRLADVELSAGLVPAFAINALLCGVAVLTAWLSLICFWAIFVSFDLKRERASSLL